MELKYHAQNSDGTLVVTVNESEWEWQEYPSVNIVSQRSGFKVGWITYSDFDSAEQCAYAAAINAILRERRGHDFGYNVPSTITKVENGWQVVIP